MIARRLDGRLHYAWVVVAITFLTLIFAAGFRSTPSVLMVPLQHEFGWSRATISLAVAVNLVLYGLSGPFAAALMLRFGIKQVMLAALTAIAVGAALTTQMRTSWQLILLWGVVIGIATGAMASGWLTDRWNSRHLLCWYYGLRGLSLFLLPVALRSIGLTLIVFVVFYGLDWVATVPPTAALATEIFGRETGGIIYGWIFASHQLGAAFAAYGAGLIRTWTGDYFLAFVTSAILCLVAAAGVLTIPSVKGRRETAPEPSAATA